MATNSNDGGSPFNRGIQHEAKQSAILSRAAKLFNTKGARATTLSDVANKLGLTKTSLYYYVKTKEDLIFQCYDASMKHALRSLDQIEQETDDPLERTLRFMRSRVDSILQALQGNADYYAAPLELASLKPQHRDALTAEYLEMFKRVRTYIREGIEAGSIRPCHSTTTTRALIGALDWSFYWLYEIPREEAEKASDAVADICANGLLSLTTDFVSSAHRIRPEAVPPAGGFDREAQNRLKQEAFFKAGTRFFNSKGFTGTSLDEIAEYLQVSKGAFYYHFANKESLLTQCYDYSLDQLQAIYNEVVVKEQPATAKLDEICRRIFTVQNSDLGPLIRYNTITALPPPIRRRVLARTEEINDHIGDIIRDGQAQGEYRPANTLVAQNMLQGAINASMNIAQWRQVDDLDATAIEYFDVFQFGLAVERR